MRHGARKRTGVQEPCVSGRRKTPSEARLARRHFLGAVYLEPSPLGGSAPPARCGAGGARVGGGFPQLTTRGRRQAGWWESPIVFEGLECPDPHTVGHASPRDGSGFDRLEQFSCL